MRLLLTATLMLVATMSQADVIIGDQAIRILTKGDVIMGGVKPDGVTQNNIVSLVSYKGKMFICEAYVNVPLSQTFIKCFNQ